MIRKLLVLMALAGSAVLQGCGGDGLNVPDAGVTNGGTSQVSPQFANATASTTSQLEAVPDGVQLVYVGDVVVLRGQNFSTGTKVFLGMNNDLATRPGSLMRTPRHLLPATPFVYRDPETGEETVLEVEVDVEVNHSGELAIAVPAAVACSPDFTNPILRIHAEGGSSQPRADVFFVVGPTLIAISPNEGVDVGGYDAIVHGDFFSRWTQVAFRYVDPVDGETKIIGNTLETDIEEKFVDRHTLIIPDWPGVVEDSTNGLSENLKVDLLLYENIDAIAEVNLGEAPCGVLTPDRPDAPITRNGVRNSERREAFTFTPTGTIDYPSIAGIVPETGPEIGGNTVIIHGDQFDAFSVDLSDPADPGIGIECPAGSGSYKAPLEAVLVDRQTIALVMPPCSVDVPEVVNFAIRNKYSMDNADGIPEELRAGPDRNLYVFPNKYSYTPIPPIEKPVVTAIYPAGPGPQPQGEGHDHGLERLLVVGDWFDSDTTLNGGFEFILDDGSENGLLVQSLRTILHNRNLIEVITKRLPAPFYPLAEGASLTADVRVRNVVGHSDFEAAFRFVATPDAGTPELAELCLNRGPMAGGNEILVIGKGFDTSTTVEVDGAPVPGVLYINDTLLVVEMPPFVAEGEAAGDYEALVAVRDGEDVTASLAYTYAEEAGDPCPILGALDPAAGSSTGGYSILAYGANLSPLVKVEFGVDLAQDPVFRSGNFSPAVRFLSRNVILVEVPEAFDDQIGATVGVAATDPLGGCPEPIKAVDFEYMPPAACAIPEIHFVETTLSRAGETVIPALSMGGGDRMLVIGKCFNQGTTFDITKNDGTEDRTLSVTALEVLSPNIAVMTSPASPDGEPGFADLVAHNADGDSDPFVVEYVEPGPPMILDVRNLNDGSQTAPIGGDRLIIFGDSFIGDVQVRLTGASLEDPDTVITLDAEAVTVVEDHLIGFSLPANRFATGALGIEVITPFGSDKFEDDDNQPIFALVGLQPPLVSGVFPSQVRSMGGDEVVFFGRNFTPTTVFKVRTGDGEFEGVLETTYVSDTVAIVLMPELDGSMPPAGKPGDVLAEETDAALVAKIKPLDPRTQSSDIFSVVNESAGQLFAVVPDHGSIDGGEQVMLLGANFLKTDGSINVDDVRFLDADGEEVGSYTRADPADLPLDASDAGKYFVINDHQILLITNAISPANPDDFVAAELDVRVVSGADEPTLSKGYVYTNTPGTRIPQLLGITPNETRLEGGSSHLLSGIFLTEAEKIVFTQGEVSYEFEINLDEMFVNDNLIVFVMPDLSETFELGDKLDIHVTKTIDGTGFVSNTLSAAIATNETGVPAIEPELSVDSGTAFGGTEVEITGEFFTTNTQVLFGTMPARIVVVESPTKVIAVAPTLPIDAPGGGLDLKSITATNGKVDVAVFTQGGWAVLVEGYQFLPAPPVVTEFGDTVLPEGESTTIHVTGEHFVPGDTTVVVSAGTVTNVRVRSFTELTFEYQAPELADDDPALVVTVDIVTSQGTDEDVGTITVVPNPTLTACEAEDAEAPAVSPTVGVAGQALVQLKLKGTNLLSGGTLSMHHDSKAGPVELVEVETLTAGGQFRVDGPTTITFTPPNVFSANTPTLLDGNPNVGVAKMTYTSPYGRLAEGDACFSYVPTLIDFDDYSFTLPHTMGGSAAMPWDNTVADINADGVPDCAVLGTEPQFAWVLLADTFGPVDINGDGEAPDFAGTFTAFEIVDGPEYFIVTAKNNNRSKAIGVANLDDDDQLEILVPGCITSGQGGSNAGRVVIYDVDENGIGDYVEHVPPTEKSYDINSLAVGDFDDDDRDDFAYITDASNSYRRLVIVTSGDGDWEFSTSAHELADAAGGMRPGKLATGDWDGNGTDDLAYGFVDKLGWGIGTTSKYEFVFVEIADGAVVDQYEMEDFRAKRTEKILAADLDGDGKDDAVLITDYKVRGPGIDPEGPGLAIVLDPFADKTSIQYTEYVRVGFAPTLGTVGDFNGDALPDVALLRAEGEFTIWYGDGKGSLVDSGRAWTVNAVSFDPFVELIAKGISAADINGDGLMELWISDTGYSPRNLVLWLNTSR